MKAAISAAKMIKLRINEDKTVDTEPDDVVLELLALLLLLGQSAL